MGDFFALAEHRTTVRRELTAGATTFMTMAYIVFVNPDILSMTGMDFGAVFTATCLAAAFGTLFMGFAANYPIALAPLMGENAFFATVVIAGVAGIQVAWETALAAVFLWGSILAVRGRRWWATVIMLVGSGMEVLGSLATAGGLIVLGALLLGKLIRPKAPSKIRPRG